MALLATMFQGSSALRLKKYPAAKAETIELKQVHLSEPVRDQLNKAGTRSGVDVLLSQVNGPALRIR